MLRWPRPRWSRRSCCGATARSMCWRRRPCRSAPGMLAGALAVQLAYGFVHGIALGFGMTMLGVAADYPLLLIGQRRAEETTRAAARRIWPTMLLAAATAALGLTAMLFSGFPGLSQLGLFSAVGAGRGGGDHPLGAAGCWSRTWRFAGSRCGGLARGGGVSTAPPGLAGRSGRHGGTLARLGHGPRWERDLAEAQPRAAGGPRPGRGAAPPARGARRAPPDRDLRGDGGGRAAERPSAWSNRSGSSVQAAASAAPSCPAAISRAAAPRPTAARPCRARRHWPSACDAATAGTAVPADGVRAVPAGCRDPARELPPLCRPTSPRPCWRRGWRRCCSSATESGTGSRCSRTCEHPELVRGNGRGAGAIRRWCTWI